MSVEKIIEKIRNEANSQASEILRSGEAERVKIETTGTKEAEKQKNQKLAAGKREVNADTSRMRAQARMEARHTVRKAREDFIKNCFDLAKEHIRTVPGDERYQEILGHLIDESIREIGSDDVILYANRRDFAVVRNILDNDFGGRGTVTLSDDPVEVTGGVILRTASGDRSVNNSFEARLDRMYRDIVIAVAEILSNNGTGKIR